MPKKQTTENISSKLGLVMRSGKATLGYKSTIKAIRSGKAQLVFIANNCPTVRKSQIEYYVMLAKIKVFNYTGSNVDLGNTFNTFYYYSAIHFL